MLGLKQKVIARAEAKLASKDNSGPANLWCHRVY